MRCCVRVRVSAYKVELAVRSKCGCMQIFAIAHFAYYVPFSFLLLFCYDSHRTKNCIRRISPYREMNYIGTDVILCDKAYPLFAWTSFNISCVALVHCTHNCIDDNREIYLDHQFPKTDRTCLRSVDVAKGKNHKKNSCR